MKRKEEIVISVFMITIGMIILLWLIIRFLNQGYFGGGPKVLYMFPFEMKDWFPTIIYSFLFSFSGVLLIKRKPYVSIICQFVIIGIVLDRIWMILSKMDNNEVFLSLAPMILALFTLIYLFLDHDGRYKNHYAKLGIVFLLNFIIIALGRLVLPNF